MKARRRFIEAVIRNAAAHERFAMPWHRGQRRIAVPRRRGGQVAEALKRA
jgi:hypothetical protein